MRDEPEHEDPGPDKGEIVSEEIIENPRQAGASMRLWNFARRCAQGWSRYKAYRDAFEIGAHVTDIELSSRIYKIALRPRFKELLSRFKAELREETNFSVEQHLFELDRIKQEAERQGDMKTALKAEERRGIVLGYGTARELKITQSPLTRQEIALRLAEIASRNPNVRQVLEARKVKILESPQTEENKMSQNVTNQVDKV